MACAKLDDFSLSEYETKWGERERTEKKKKATDIDSIFVFLISVCEYLGNAQQRLEAVYQVDFVFHLLDLVYARRSLKCNEKAVSYSSHFNGPSSNTNASNFQCEPISVNRFCLFSLFVLSKTKKNLSFCPESISRIGDY